MPTDYNYPRRDHLHAYEFNIRYNISEDGVVPYLTIDMIGEI
jgi:hypothetical protein